MSLKNQIVSPRRSIAASVPRSACDWPAGSASGTTSTNIAVDAVDFERLHRLFDLFVARAAADRLRRASGCTLATGSAIIGPAIGGKVDRRHHGRLAALFDQELGLSHAGGGPRLPAGRRVEFEWCGAFGIARC